MKANSSRKWLAPTHRTAFLKNNKNMKSQLCFRQEKQQCKSSHHGSPAWETDWPPWGKEQNGRRKIEGERQASTSFWRHHKRGSAQWQNTLHAQLCMSPASFVFTPACLRDLKIAKPWVLKRGYRREAWRQILRGNARALAFLYSKRSLATAQSDFKKGNCVIEIQTHCRKSNFARTMKKHCIVHVSTWIVS